MDYLREGINLRLGQRDPLFGGSVTATDVPISIDDDYVKYVMHAQVQS